MLLISVLFLLFPSAGSQDTSDENKVLTELTNTAQCRAKCLLTFNTNTYSEEEKCQECWSVCEEDQICSQGERLEGGYSTHLKHTNKQT